ncbi:MAG: hypothetical protein HBSAPP03_07830 [Phycisphaerae bacterium]|nr:MAG: hypothetical protein HBSAPP03_07830 [Phycisphaerae bacterium]
MNPHGTLETRVSRLLTLGTVLAAAVLLTGVVMYVGANPEDRPVYAPFSPTGLRSLTTVLARLREGDAAAIMQAGVLLLVLTPVARVVTTLIVFAARRDWRYVVIAAVVLTTLVLGLAGIRL